VLVLNDYEIKLEHFMKTNMAIIASLIVVITSSVFSGILLLIR
jgi:hypothetical protein